MYGFRNNLLLYHSKHVKNIQIRLLCNTPTTMNNNKHNKQSTATNNNVDNKVPDIRDLEAYRDLDNLDFMKAAKILFTNPPKKKKFGLDFHLVQLFFVCMPSLAVYLVAQYARYEMRKMEADLELKKKAEVEKAQEMEASAADEKSAIAENKESGSELLKVKERLEALEETVKVIAVEAKMRPFDTANKNLGGSQNEKHPTDRMKAIDAPANGQLTTKGTSLEPGRQIRTSVVVGDDPKQDEKQKER